MVLTLLQTKTAICPGNTASFLGAGGTAPYGYSVLSGGQGGTINPVSGIYTAPSFAAYNSAQTNVIDVIQVTDAVDDTVTGKIRVEPPLLLFIDIISTVMQLPAGRCFLYNGKGFQPTDAGLYVAVEVTNVKAFANSYHFNAATETFENFVNVGCTLDVHVISVDNSALFLKETVLASLMSPYSLRQQEANAFSIGRIPPAAQFNNLSEIDGPAIPYHFQISIGFLYSVSTSFATDVFTSFAPVALVVNP